MPEAAEPWSLASLREKLIKVGAKVMSLARYVTLQTAEAVSRQMFADTPSLIARLRTLALRPDIVLVAGDTNWTLAAALAAAKPQVPVAHLEAGWRSFNRAMPEEINRVLTDHLSTILLCPIETAIANLRREGIVTGVQSPRQSSGFSIIRRRPRRWAGAADGWRDLVQLEVRRRRITTIIPMHQSAIGE
jgi:hypothetical protein